MKNVTEWAIERWRKKNGHPFTLNNFLIIYAVQFLLEVTSYICYTPPKSLKYEVSAFVVMRMKIWDYGQSSCFI
jgi:hypothetical protein